MKDKMEEEGKKGRKGAEESGKQGVKKFSYWRRGRKKKRRGGRGFQWLFNS